MYPKYNNNINSMCPYDHYYTHQAGSGIGVIYKGASHQRGHGIGSFLGGLFRSVLPLLRNGAKVVGKEALNAGVGLLSDMVQTKPLDESLKYRIKEATTNLKRKADDKIDRVMKGSGYKSKKQQLMSISQSQRSKQRTLKKGRKNTKNIKINDIFS